MWKKVPKLDRHRADGYWRRCRMWGFIPLPWFEYRVMQGDREVHRSVVHSEHLARALAFKWAGNTV